MSHQLPKCRLKLSTSMARSHAVDRPDRSIWARTNHTGAFMTSCRHANAATIPHRIDRMFLRIGHRNSARSPPIQAIKGVLVDAANTITIDEAAPTVAKTHDFPRF